MSKSGKSATLAITLFLFSSFFLNPVANMTANYVCIKYKSLWKEEMSYSGGIWYVHLKS